MDSIHRPLLDKSSSGISDLEKDAIEYDSQIVAPKHSSLRSRAIPLALLLSLFFNLLLFSQAISSRATKPACPSLDPIWGVKDELYSPAQSAIKYERRVFGELGRTNKFYGPPTDETDEAWYSLYPVGISRITEYEAALLPNWTERIPGDEDHFIISLDVFHQLHCLNAIRKGLHPERYPPPPPDEVFPGEPFDHIDHCLNYIREAIMCHGDVTMSVWHWEEWRHKSFPKFDTLHTCRNWESLTQWAADHALLEPFNDRIRVIPTPHPHY